MRTSIKQKAIHCLEHGFYPKHVVKKFLSKQQNKNAGSWVKTLEDPQVLLRYVYCRDVKFYGYTEKTERCKRAYYRSCGVTPKKMESFLHLNNELLLDVYENTTHEKLKSYYKALACLNGIEPKASCFLYERRKMKELVHKLQAKLINSFINEAPSTEDLRNFVIISVLFSEGDLLHDEVTKDSFVKLCTMC
ncbi:MAG: hypothetical protein IJF12_02525 [Alphaproteobacteria bacterium]|nr:hypothetical protein [Alphaproteobacteria bacterium]